MSRRRILPEAAYDFWARDGRDGERSHVCDTLRDARAVTKEWRATLDAWNRCVITVGWEVSERKVLRLLRTNRKP